MTQARRNPRKLAATDFRRQLSIRYQKAEQNWERDMDKLHALFLAQGKTSIARKDLTPGDLRKEAVQALGGLEREEAEYLADCLDLHYRRTQALYQQIKKEADGDDVLRRLQSVPGVGPVLALTFASYVPCEIFHDRGQASNYIGLTPDSNKKDGKVKGNDYLRNLLIRAALTVARSPEGGKLKERYEYLTREKSKDEMQAVLAVARQMAEMLYTLTMDGDRHGADSHAAPALRS